MVELAFHNTEFSRKYLVVYEELKEFKNFLKKECRKNPNAFLAGLLRVFPIIHETDFINPINTFKLEAKVILSEVLYQVPFLPKKAFYIKSSRGEPSLQERLPIVEAYSPNMDSDASIYQTERVPIIKTNSQGGYTIIKKFCKEASQRREQYKKSYKRVIRELDNVSFRIPRIISNLNLPS